MAAVVAAVTESGLTNCQKPAFRRARAFFTYHHPGSLPGNPLQLFSFLRVKPIEVIGPAFAVSTKGKC
jgi:hypothetical protein